MGGGKKAVVTGQKARGSGGESEDKRKRRQYYLHRIERKLLEGGLGSGVSPEEALKKTYLLVMPRRAGNMEDVHVE